MYCLNKVYKKLIYQSIIVVFEFECIIVNDKKNLLISKNIIFINQYTGKNLKKKRIQWLLKLFAMEDA